MSDDGDGRRRKTLARATSATTSITRDLTVLSDVGVEVNSGITNGADHQHTRMYTHWRSRIPNWLRSGTDNVRKSIRKLRPWRASAAAAGWLSCPSLTTLHRHKMTYGRIGHQHHSMDRNRICARRPPLREDIMARWSIKCQCTLHSGALGTTTKYIHHTNNICTQNGV